MGRGGAGRSKSLSHGYDCKGGGYTSAANSAWSAPRAGKRCNSRSSVVNSKGGHAGLDKQSSYDCKGGGYTSAANSAWSAPRAGKRCNSRSSVLNSKRGHAGLDKQSKGSQSSPDVSRRSSRSDSSKGNGKAGGKGGKSQTAFVDPCSVKFSQGSCSPTFRDGTHVDDTKAMLRNRDLQKRDIPMVKVTPGKDGQLWAHDHRRLKVFQYLAREGHCRRIKVEVTNEPVPAFKRSTKCNGDHIDMKSLPHDHVVKGWQYSTMSPLNYTYIGKDHDNEPLYLTDKSRSSVPTYSDLDRATSF